MATIVDHGTTLLRLAAEAIAPAVPGCADLLTAARGALAMPGNLAGRLRAIDLFGPGIVARWQEWLGRHDEGQQLRALEQLASLSPTQAHEIAAQAVEALCPAADTEDRRLAVAYLAAIPTAARELPSTGQRAGKFQTPGPTLTPSQELVRLLPMNAPPFLPGSVLPGSPYLLEELLGTGGFGVVYRASNRFEQNTPPRAIKLCIQPDMVASLKHERNLLDRLMSAGREAQWSDRIVKLYGHSLDAPIPFLVYEYVPGGDLLTRLAALRKQGKGILRPPQVLGLVRRICEALAFAHGWGLVHRDIKPSNILVSGNTIKLADFGIGGVVADFAARTSAVDGAPSCSDRCSLFQGAGTPLYMSPEQRRGEPPDPRQDVYSLGVMWYQFLCGDHTREMHPGWEDELADEFDVPQRQIDLIQQCVGYVKKRPASAKELLAELPPPGTIQFSAVKIDRAGGARTLQGHEGVVNCLVFAPNSRRLLSGAGDGTARLWDLETGTQLACYRLNARSVHSLAISPDNRRALLGCDSNNAWLWDLSRHAELACFAGHSRPVTCVAFSPDGRRAVTGSEDRSVCLWHVGAGREVLRIEEHRKRVNGLAFTPDGQFILSCSEDGTIGIWDSETGWESQQLASPGSWLLCLAVSPDGGGLACGSQEGLALWDLEQGKIAGTFEGHTLAVMAVSFAPNGQWLLSGSLDKTARLWSVTTRRQVQVFEGHKAGVLAAAIAPDGRGAATASGSVIHLWMLPSH